MAAVSDDDKPGIAEAGSGAEFVVVYATFASESEAQTIAEALVGSGLVACANIVPRVSSVFIWEGRVQREQESVAVMKTRAALAREVIEQIKRLHSYDVPAITVWPIVAGAPDYLAWIGEQTARRLA
jgi:periplasmic divalent cation tolerance protein